MLMIIRIFKTMNNTTNLISYKSGSKLITTDVKSAIESYNKNTMKQYNFKLNCGDDIINGTKISVEADDEHAARVKVVDALGRVTRNLQVESLELLGTLKPDMD